MQSLFLKIFLWFWATVIVTGIALLLTFVLEPRSVPSRWHATLEQTARYTGSTVVAQAEQHGAPAAADYIARVKRDAQIDACLFDAGVRAIAGSDCQGFRSLAAQASRSNRAAFSMRYGIARVALAIPGNSGREYLFATELPAGPRAALGISRSALALQWTVALVVSGFICYLLTRYLTQPIFQLREASRQLAAGELRARAGPRISARHDELGQLVRDFNAMAARIEELVARQRQLTSDVSHELRSPLARLNVALDLGRERKGNDPAFDQMQRDLELLDTMIGRLLTLAKLDASAAPVPMAPVDLTGLAEDLVSDANFEAHERNVTVTLTACGRHFVHGNSELLRSAVENVVRNAVRYTAPGTTVEVLLEVEPGPDAPRAKLVVSDHGPGLPESELAKIFQPFHRVADARDRASGGVGLGLAIAERVIRIHGGTIAAQNSPQGGLHIQILLPHADSTRSRI